MAKKARGQQFGKYSCSREDLCVNVPMELERFQSIHEIASACCILIFA
ncbi:hypothetical protein FDUTEX481_06039 [Tolypothrix sp. PCC 7601]|nr:hypothetical protein FDUTEX481_06039 [Tolypothrix sp. PCC 7601]